MNAFWNVSPILLTGAAVGAVFWWISRDLQRERKASMPIVGPGPDGPAHPARICACCGGMATRLMTDRETSLLICANRKLCDLTIRYANMLANVRSGLEREEH